MTVERCIGDVRIVFDPDAPWADAFAGHPASADGDAPGPRIVWHDEPRPRDAPTVPPAFHHGPIRFYPLDGGWLVQDPSLSIEVPARFGPVRVALRVPPDAVEEAALQVTALAALALALRTHGWFHLHAASIGERGRRWALVGASGAGKTTATLDCLLAGFSWSTDDVAFARLAGDRVEIAGWPRLFHVTDATLRRDPRLVPALRPGRSLLGKHRLDASSLQAPAAAPARVDGVLLPTLALHEPTTRLERVSAAESFVELVHASPWVTLPCFGDDAAHEDALAALARLPTWRLRIGADAAQDPSRVPGVIADLEASR